MTNISSTILGCAIYVCLGLLVGSWFAPDIISTNLPATEWANLMTYVWIVLWPFILFFKFLFWFCVIGFLAFAGFCIHAVLTDR